MINKKGSILISALWIIAILTVFAVSVGRESSAAIKLTMYNIESQKAYNLARAGIYHVFAQKQLEYKRGMNNTIDTLNQKWANNEVLFKEYKLGGGYYKIGYKFKELDNSEEGEVELYGLMDEQSKINVNNSSYEILQRLFESCGMEAETAFLASNNIIESVKNRPFETIYETFLIEQIDGRIFNELKNYVTVYGDGRVNINTAGEKVLNALFGEDYPNLAEKIIRYRRGNDEVIGTKDDRWFCIGTYVIDREEEGLVEIKNLQEEQWYANIYNISVDEYNRVRELLSGAESILCVSSMTYCVISTGDVNGTSSVIEAVCKFELDSRYPKILYWYQE